MLSALSQYLQYIGVALTLLAAYDNQCEPLCTLSQTFYSVEKNIFSVLTKADPAEPAFQTF